MGSADQRAKVYFTFHNAVNTGPKMAFGKGNTKWQWHKTLPAYLGGFIVFNTL